jgi:hypothetical protein
MRIEVFNDKTPKLLTFFFFQGICEFEVGSCAKIQSNSLSRLGICDFNDSWTTKHGGIHG